MPELLFWTTLLCVDRPNEKALQALKANCTHVIDSWWIMEGDADYLREEGVRYEQIAEGSVGALGGLSSDELLKVCKESYGIDLVRMS